MSRVHRDHCGVPGTPDGWRAGDSTASIEGRPVTGGIMTTTGTVRDFAELRLADAEEAGGKGANLGEMTSAGLPVPPGFVLLRDAYRESVRAVGVDRELLRLHREALEASADEARLGELSSRCRELVSRPG
jgi:pyruvate,water dikinase